MLAAFEDPRLVPLLVGLLQDKSAWRLWHISLMTLVRLGDPAAESTLLRILADDSLNLGMRMDAIWGLARLESQAALPLLERYANANVERPVIPGPTPREGARVAMERSLREQGVWKLKLMAGAAIQHIRNPELPMRPDYERIQPLPPPKPKR